jgi:hypothetical protein
MLPGATYADSRVRCWSLMFTDALTLVEEDCAVFGWFV